MKTRRIRSGHFAALAAMALTLVAGRAQAGAGGGGRAASCVFNADKTGYCAGSLETFRNSPDATAYLTLQTYLDTSGGTSRYITVTSGGTYKFIAVSGTAAVTSLFDTIATAINPNATFYVHWNASGTADAFQVFNTSSAY